MSSPTRKCPRCGRAFRAVPGSPWRPFCSERCQFIDLGGWLSERHVIPGEELPPDEPPDREDKVP